MFVYQCVRVDHFLDEECSWPYVYKDMRLWCAYDLILWQRNAIYYQKKYPFTDPLFRLATSIYTVRASF